MFILPKLPYEYWELEPNVDTQTMIVHHTKHHQTYIDKLNNWLIWTEYSGLTNFDLIELVSDISKYQEPLKNLIKNHWWWHLNHILFRESLTPRSQNIDNFDIIKWKINNDFGDFENFQKQFTEKAMLLFWSWRTWLELDKKNNKLQITNYQNQENPYMYWYQAILWLDLREHAYYLNNQNRRADYVSKRRNIVNWNNINTKLSNS